MNRVAACDQHKRVKEKPEPVESPSSSALSQEGVSYIIDALVMLIFVTVAVLGVFCRKIMTNVLFKGALESEVYNESAEVANQKAIRTDIVLTNSDHEKWL